MIVYRIEDRRGLGPFCGPAHDDILPHLWDYCAKRNLLYHHTFPDPQSDRCVYSGCSILGVAHCGCATFLQLWRWFGTWIVSSYVDEYFLCKYEVDDAAVAVLSRQVVFDIKAGRKIETIPLNDLARRTR